MSSPAVIVPVSHPPYGYSRLILETLRVKPMTESTEFCLDEIARASLSPMEIEMLDTIELHSSRSPNTLSGKILLICRRYQSNVPTLIMRKLQESFPHTPWEEIFNMSGSES